MNEDELLDIYSYEMEHPDLAEVPQTFYQDLEEFLKELEAKVREDFSYWKKYQNFLAIIQRIKEKRLEKILLAALNNVKLKMLPEEEILYNRVRELIEHFGELSQTTVEQPKEEKAEEQEEKKEEGPKMLKVRITTKVDAYYGLDGNKYGPYEVGEVVELPEQEAKWLVESEFAEFVE
ncbi:MAG: DNA replication complex GINS family protein [Candidatus Micrarchaeota archaeon]|nr:DNA replication complex GINS family protein [Candidatus Micrarchaeota archaeon]